MSVGFALLFTPLFTVCLSSVRPELYSHGSAVLGSLQQVAGAAGVALFVALMSAQTARLTAAGAAPIEALAGGIRAAFLCGAVCSLLAVACAFLVRKPDVHATPLLTDKASRDLTAPTTISSRWRQGQPSSSVYVAAIGVSAVEQRTGSLAGRFAGKC